MGSSQSRLSSPIVAEKLSERLRALELKESRNELEKGYVYVEGEARKSNDSSPRMVSSNAICSSSILPVFNDGIYQHSRAMGEGTLGRSKGLELSSNWLACHTNTLLRTALP